MFRFIALAAVVMVLLAVVMMVFGGLKENLQVQIAGLAMYAIALSMIFQLSLWKIESRLRTIEERFGAETPPLEDSKEEPKDS